jgi:hypothetical protein
MRLLLLLFPALAFAQVPDGAPEPRDLGHRAVMHVYWYAPATLEITHVDTYFFPDERACSDAAGKAGLIATPHASQGDLVNVQCVAMHPPERVKPAPKPGEAVL